MSDALFGGSPSEFEDDLHPTLAARDCRTHDRSVLLDKGHIAFAKSILKRRRARDELFPDVSFGEPAWDMLLDLYVAEGERRHVSISSLAIAAAVPSTTALRYMQTLAEARYIVRNPDPFDGRRALVRLQGEALGRLDEFLRKSLTSTLL